MYIVMIRHGLSEANINNLISGSNETPLSEIGKNELISLRNVLDYPKTNIYISSPLSRCLDTFETIFPDQNLHRTDERFKEVCFGDYEGKTLMECNLDDYFIKFFKNENISNNELYFDFFNRIKEGIMSVINEMQLNNYTSATIVAHSTVIKTIVKNISNISVENYRSIPIKNGHGYIFDFDIVDSKIVINEVKQIGIKQGVNNE